MTEANQKKMYEGFMRMSKEGDTDTKRANCLKYAKQILSSFPHFAKAEVPKAILPAPDKVRKDSKKEK